MNGCLESVNSTWAQRLHALMWLSEHDVVFGNGAFVVCTFEAEFLLVTVDDVEHGAQGVRVS